MTQAGQAAEAVREEGAGWRVLMVVTSSPGREGMPRTGVWFEEYAIPFRELVGAGARVTVASPKGGVAPVDPRSLLDEASTEAYGQAWDRLQNTRVLARVSEDDFDAVFFPGGHGPMFDLATDADAKRLAAAFADAGKVVGAVCHGPAALFGVVRADGTALVAGRRLTSFTAAEDRAGELGRYMPFVLQDALTAEGARFVDGGMHAAHVEVDGLLVTGQNPQSSAVTTQAFLDVLRSAPPSTRGSGRDSTPAPEPGAERGPTGTADAAAGPPSDRAAGAHELARGVFYLEGDPERWWCNHGWIEFTDFVLVLDASMPTGAARAWPIIQATTRRPVRFVLDTHAHPDHAYANAFWSSRGVLPVATAGVVADLRATEPGQLGGVGPGLWEEVTPLFPELAATHLVAPTVLLGEGTTFDDGTHRVELISVGPAHTRSDTVAWLPRERVLFAADVVSSGPHNTFAEADVNGWLQALDRLAALDPVVVVPGHGPRGGPELIAAQRAYLQALLDAVRDTTGTLPDRADAADDGGEDAAGQQALSVALPRIRRDLAADPRAAGLVPPDDPALPDRLSLAGHLTAIHAATARSRAGAAGTTGARATGRANGEASAP